MKITEAIDQIHTMVYKPGWRFEAEDHTNRFQDTVKVTIHYPAYNSDREQAPEYFQSIMTRAAYGVYVGDLNTDDLSFALLSFIISIESHEAREFLRYPGTLESPFHPHRDAGMKNWADRIHQADIFGVTGDVTPTTDRLFGLA